MQKTHCWVASMLWIQHTWFILNRVIFVEWTCYQKTERSLWRSRVVQLFDFFKGYVKGTSKQDEQSLQFLTELEPKQKEEAKKIQYKDLLIWVSEYEYIKQKRGLLLHQSRGQPEWLIQWKDTQKKRGKCSGMQRLRYQDCKGLMCWMGKS
jgi:hypothetical protein